MANVMDILKLCRLCLVKEDVTIPIFDGQGDVRQIFLKISSCLPVKVSRKDCLPKNICSACSNKLDVLYEFSNTTTNSEKQLIQWLNEAGVDTSSNVLDSNSHSIPDETIVLKQEAIEVGGDDVSTDAKGYILQPQQISYDASSFEFQNQFTTNTQASTTNQTEENVSTTNEPPAKRKRTASPKKKAPPKPVKDEEEDSANEESGSEFVAKMEDDSDDDNDANDDANDPDYDADNFDDVPSTSVDDQPGPSGVGKPAGDPPVFTSRKRLSSNPNDLDSTIQDCINEEIILINETETINCKICNKTFTSHMRLLKHKRLQHPRTIRRKMHDVSSDVVCKICNKTFDFENKLLLHLETHQEKTYACDICNKMLISERMLTIHKKYCHNDAYRVCNICDKVCINNSALRYHKRVVHRIYKRLFNTERYKVIHEGYRYKCDKCTKTYASKISFREHLKSHDPNYIKQSYKCPECDKIFYSIRNVRRHQKHSHGTRPICEICGRAGISDMKVHMRTHTGEKPYKCNYCDKSFAKHSTYKTHLRTHTNERPYQCEKCGKCFTETGSLNLHKRVHTGEKPYRCVICEKRFVIKASLNYHMKMHERKRLNEVKYHCCQTCGKCFKKIGNLINHVRLHTDEKPYTCDICHKTFVMKTNLTAHLKTH